MQGQLFTQDFLVAGIAASEPWRALPDAQLDAFAARLQQVVGNLAADSALNEAQTEQEIIVPLLRELGWADDWLPQVNASGSGRESVPDYLLFADAEAKARALRERRDERRYAQGLAILEAKRWLRPLDRGDAREAADPGAPSSQMLRYLSRVDVMSDRAVKWGILTNGAVWRLYWQDARSRVEDFFEVDLAPLVGLPGAQAALDTPADPRHGVKLFYLLFRRAAFLPQPWDDNRRSFHAYARDEARHYEESVSHDLGQRVFNDVFPLLAQAIAQGDPAAARDADGRLARAYLTELHEATLVLLYRLLFVFYAEDRALLPAHEPRYRGYSIRALRDEVRNRRDRGDTLSAAQTLYWDRLRNLFTAVANGDDAIGLPAYNGGLFEPGRAPILERARVPDAVLAPALNALSCRADVLHAWINYRDLSVSHLGGIYERLLEYTLVDTGGTIEAQPASFARRTSGSYYTHDALVALILKESVGRLIDERRAAFAALLKRYRRKPSLTPPEWQALSGTDPATRVLDLTVCDPAMGSGHFLVALVDHLADAVLELMDEAEHAVAGAAWAAHLAERGTPWVSPLAPRIAAIRARIQSAAQAHRWTVTAEQLDDRHIVRRMVLKKSVYGLDKNPMAVELAKVALWLHTFTVGAPLSFLDHHLRCGDSLHGERLPQVQADIRAFGVLLQEGELARLDLAAQSLTAVAELTDVDIAETRESRRLTDDAAAQVAPIHALLDFWRAARWLVPGWPVNKLARIKDEADRGALAELLSGRMNLVGAIERGHIDGKGAAVAAANQLLEQTCALAARERFFHWWTAFPTVFARGGFDAVIGNPPWDRIKLQQVEWFAERRPAIAHATRAADRKRLIEALERDRDPLAADYAQAAERAETAARVFRDAGDYPLLAGGDVNLYSLFVERAQALVAPNGLVGLLTPSGIAADKGAAKFFGELTGSARLAVLYDFENRDNPGGSFFPDVDSRFKFCVLVFGGAQRSFDAATCAFYLHAAAELADPDRVLRLTAADFKLVNPNTGAAPIFRTARDAQIVTGIYRRHPVLVDRSGGSEKRAWPVRYLRMFDMTNDSSLFMTRAELECDGWKPTELNRWKKGKEVAVPLYEGKMVQMYDHRAADVVVNAANLHRPAQPEEISAFAHADPARLAVPQFWVRQSQAAEQNPFGWAFGFKEITAPTNERSMIAALLPGVGFGNKVPILVEEDGASQPAAQRAVLLIANFNALAFDFVLRQKLQGQTINLFILEQLPVIAPVAFDAKLGKTTIADFVRGEVLRLSYTAHDIAPFARDLGYVDKRGAALPPFAWTEADRRRRMARLDALFMHLYGLTREDAEYILASFPIVREKDEAAHGRYLTRDLVLGFIDQLAGGDVTGFAGEFVSPALSP